jgi:hypothetical protein
MTAPLSALKVVVTMPPPEWFGGVDFDFAVEMAEEVRALGATVFELDTAPFVWRNASQIDDAIEAVRRFRPDVALSLPNAGYLLLCCTLSGANIFRDVLQIPSIMLWDHGLFQLPARALDPLPLLVEEAQPDALARIREVIDHPLYHHYSPDRGHTDALDRLGILSRDKVQWFLQPPYPNFVKFGYREAAAGAFRTRVAFAGNVYLNSSAQLPFAGVPELVAIQEDMVATKIRDLTVPLWDILMSRIDALRPGTRQKLGLVPDSSFFWRFVYDQVALVGNTSVRLHVLTGLKREFDFFGNFMEPGATTELRTRYRINVRKSLDYFTELPLLFMNSDVVVDVVNLGYNSGISPKIMGCFACGGLALFDYKPDFEEAMGNQGHEVMYRTVDELNTLVDRYLGDPRRRRDVSRYLQHLAVTRYSFTALCRRILAEEPAWRASAAAHN